MKAVYNFSYLLVTLLLCGSGCESFLKIDNPKTELITSEVFKNDLTATAAIANVYGSMSFVSGGINSITFQAPLLADEAIPPTTAAALVQLYNNNVPVTHNSVQSFWNSSGYNLIYQLNALIEGVKGSSALSPELKIRLEGEALFLRGFIHFYLVNFYGPVPYVTTTDYRLNTTLSRLPVTEVFTHIITDLENAATRLPSDYSFSDGEKIRANKWVAIAMLARVNLYARNWAKAEQYAIQIISETNLFQLNELSDVFLANSSETIWQLKPVFPGKNTNEGDIFILDGVPRYSTLSPQMVNAFEANDKRRENWIGDITINDKTYFFPFKYKIKNGQPGVEYSTIIRLAELYLIRAEARAQLNDLTNALTDVDVIRSRGQLPLLKDTNPAMTKENLLLAIEHERQVELFSEWGHRWLDLKRTDRATAVLAPIKAGWSPTDVLLPLPGSEVLINPNYQQNPGY